MNEFFIAFREALDKISFMDLLMENLDKSLNQEKSEKQERKK